MADASVPLVFWAGYTSPVLVSSAHLQNWSVVVSQNPTMKILPRRWFDISGRKIADLWAAATRAVIGILVFRPGITQVRGDHRVSYIISVPILMLFRQAELRWRLRSVYDRQEVNDILRHLQEEGFVDMCRCPPAEEEQAAFAMLDDEEEKTAFWFLGEAKHWYQV